jgi:hypothetical protein
MREMLLSQKGATPRTVLQLQNTRRAELRLDLDEKLWKMFIPKIRVQSISLGSRTTLHAGHQRDLPLDRALHGPKSASSTPALS